MDFKVPFCMDPAICRTAGMSFHGSGWLKYGSCGAVKKGDRIAQLILERIMTPEVEEVEDLDATVRGSGGYGSTGVSS